MIRLLPITDELFEQDVVLLRQRLDEFAVEEIADIVPVEVEDVVVVAAHAVVVDHEIDERARRAGTEFGVSSLMVFMPLTSPAYIPMELLKMIELMDVARRPWPLEQLAGELDGGDGHLKELAGERLGLAGRSGRWARRSGSAGVPGRCR